MGGGIWGESQYEVGSTFHISLPFKKQEQLPTYALLKAHLDSKKILLVDDEEIARNVYSNILRNFGYKVTEVSSGRDALNTLKNNDMNTPFDMVIMDWKMPDMDGIETTQFIQISGEINHQPEVVLMSGANIEEFDNLLQKVVFSGFLKKPSTPSTVLDTVIFAFAGQKYQGQVFNDNDRSNKYIQQLSGAKLLLVEDHPINQELAAELLMSHEIEVKIANNGQEALQILEEDEFDGILMDCQMPVMDGYEATQQIRQQEKYKDLPIIALTANALVGDKEKVLAVGMNDHISKPIKPELMFETITKWITPGKKENVLTEKSANIEETLLDENGFPELPGIDVQAGLVTTHNNASLYKRLLFKFHENQKNFKQEFMNAKKDSDPQATTHIAHTLKGLAGNLGMTKLQQNAFSLETACKEKSEHIDELLKETVSQLDIVFSSLDKLDSRSQ